MNQSIQPSANWTPQKVHQMTVKHNLQPADVIRIKANTLPLVDHYAVYLGYLNGDHQFAAAMISGGVKILKQKDFDLFGGSYHISSVRRFKGGYAERENALDRAYEMLVRAYNPAGMNCENFANYVQTGKSWSRQTRNISVLGVAGGSYLAVKSKGNFGKILGLLIALLSIIALFADAFSTPKKENTRSFQWQT